MIEIWMIFALFLPSPMVFAVGFVVGKQHVRHPARHGGEDGYPMFVQRTVKRYRTHHEWIDSNHD